MVQSSPDNLYETDALLAQYGEFHYGDEYFGIGNFPAHCARRCLEFMVERRKGAALDVGCAVGRTTFELAREFATVTGMDSSRRFIEAAAAMRDEGRLSYRLVEEGDLITPVERRLVDFELDGVRERVAFVCADALSLSTEYSGYDLVFAGNLIDRLKHPRNFLLSLAQRIHADGLLVLTSPYSWSVEFTPRAEWLGGCPGNGRIGTSLEGLQAVLIPHFRMLVEPEDIPFVIRETSRKYQHTIAQMTVWERCR